MIAVYSLIAFALVLLVLDRAVGFEIWLAERSLTRWVSFSHRWTRLECDAEARFAAEQVVELRKEINLLRKLRKILRPWRYLRGRSKRGLS